MTGESDELTSCTYLSDAAHYHEHSLFSLRIGRGLVVSSQTPRDALFGGKLSHRGNSCFLLITLTCVNLN